MTPPKMKKSIRTIGMSKTVADILREQKKYTDDLKIALGDNYAHNEMAIIMTEVSLKRFTKGTEFEYMTLHKLRHCNATMFLNMEVDLKIISDHLGRCDINVTDDIYAGVLSSTRKLLEYSIDKKLTE